MKRNQQELEGREFDVLVVGGGMFGACIAWEASLRGYSVALVEKGDFASATSSNHYKFIHGGIRYLQHADVARMRESSREKSALIRIAPHLASPMPVVLPTFGRGRKGKLIMRGGMLAYDVLTFDRNRRITDPARRTPRGSVLGRREVLQRFPGVPKQGLTGAAVFHDGQMYNPPRLVLAFISSAAAKGAAVANYTEVEQFIEANGRVAGCIARDLIGDKSLEIRSRVTINAGGPWAAELLSRGTSADLQPRPSFSRDLAFVVDRSVSPTHTLGCQSSTQDTDALLDRGGRHVFLAPWRGKTVVGVWHKYTKARPDRLSVSNEELESFLAEINSSYSGLDLRLDDIKLINTGLILFGSEDDQASGSEHSFAKRSVVVDHAEQGVEGLVTVVGARATVARGVAEKTMNIVDRKLGKSAAKSSSEWQKITGGDFDSFDGLVRDVSASLPERSRHAARAVAHNYGAAYGRLLKSAPGEKYLESIGASHVLKAEVVHAVQQEMATNLADIVFRRTELCTAGDPGQEELETAAEIAAQCLGWDRQELQAQLAFVRATVANRGPWHFVPRNDALPQGE